MQQPASPQMSPSLKTRPGMSKPSTEMAGRGDRFVAALVDGLLAVALYAIAFFLEMPGIILVGLLLLGIYQIYLLTVDGQTIGKKVARVKIVKIDTGENGGFVTNVLMRGILNGLLGFIPFYALVDILFIFREDRRCIHDMIAGTVVVKE